MFQIQIFNCLAFCRRYQNKDHFLGLDSDDIDMNRSLVVRCATLLLLVLAFGAMKSQGEEFESEYCVNNKCLRCPSGCDLRVTAPVITSDTEVGDLECECICSGETEACIGSSSTIFRMRPAWTIAAAILLSSFVYFA